MARWRPSHHKTAVAAAIAAALAAPAAGAQTLTDALVAAYTSRPQLLADRDRQAGLDEDVARARGGWKPQVSVSGQAGFGKDRLVYGYLVPPETVREDIHPEALVAQLSQTIYDGGKTSSDIAHSQYAVAGGLYHLEAVEAQVLGDGIQAYYDLYRDQVVLGLTRQAVRGLRQELAGVQARFARQDVTVADVTESQSRLARGLADQAAAEAAVASSASEFQQATGLVPGTLPPPPPLPLALLPGTAEQAVALASENPTVREAEYQEKMAETDVDAAESALKPQLSLQFSDQYLSETSQGHFKTQYQEGLLNLQVPIYSGGVDYARVREAKTIVAERAKDVDEDREEARDKVRRALDQVAAARERIVTLQEQVGYAQRAVTAIGTEVRVGTREVIDLLNAEQELLEAQIALAQTQHDLGIATYTAMSLIGRLDARTLHLPVQYYDANAYYAAESSRWIGTNIPGEYGAPSAATPSAPPAPKTNAPH